MPGQACLGSGLFYWYLKRDLKRHSVISAELWLCVQGTGSQALMSYCPRAKDCTGTYGQKQKCRQLIKKGKAGTREGITLMSWGRSRQSPGPPVSLWGLYIVLDSNFSSLGFPLPCCIHQMKLRGQKASSCPLQSDFLHTLVLMCQPLVLVLQPQ